MKENELTDITDKIFDTLMGNVGIFLILVKLSGYDISSKYILWKTDYDNLTSELDRG